MKIEIQSCTITTVMNTSDKPDALVVRLAEQMAWSKKFADLQEETTLDAKLSTARTIILLVGLVASVAFNVYQFIASVIASEGAR